MDTPRFIKDYELHLLYLQCRNFVNIACKDRDESHGLQHMIDVTKNACLISYDMDLSVDTWKKIIISSMLHDVLDHKYEHNEELSDKVSRFIDVVIPEHKNKIYLVINSISFSKEAKEGMRYFEKDLGNSEWIVVRDIVSDADKIEALGEIGFNRCVKFTKESFAKKHPRKTFTDEDIIDNVWKHSQEKLLLLYNHYIVTTPGKGLAKPRHLRLLSLLKENGIDHDQLTHYYREI